MVQSIRKKEQVRWPEGAADHASSLAYLKGLDVAEDAAREAFLSRANQNDERRKMMTELVLAGGESFFATYVIDARKVDDGFDVLSARPVALQDVTPSYIRGAMRTQCANAFKLSEVELDALLASPPSAK